MAAITVEPSVRGRLTLQRAATATRPPTTEAGPAMTTSVPRIPSSNPTYLTTLLSLLLSRPSPLSLTPTRRRNVLRNSKPGRRRKRARFNSRGRVMLRKPGKSLLKWTSLELFLHQAHLLQVFQMLHPQERLIIPGMRLLLSLTLENLTQSRLRRNRLPDPATRPRRSWGWSASSHQSLSQRHPSKLLQVFSLQRSAARTRLTPSQQRHRYLQTAPKLAALASESLRRAR